MIFHEAIAVLGLPVRQIITGSGDVALRRNKHIGQLRLYFWCRACIGFT